MRGRAPVIAAALGFSTGVVFGPRPARAEGPPKASVEVDLSGRWTLNVRLSDDAREKMREATEDRRGSGMGGGSPMGGRAGGGRTGPPPGSGDDRREAMRAILEPAEQLTITHGAPSTGSASGSEIVVEEAFGRTRTLHPDGRKYKTENGTAEIRTRFKDGRLLVETQSARGRKVTETWELVPDRSRLIVNVRLEGGFGGALALKRVYDRLVEPPAAPAP
jgi:hypothetical protein